MLIDHDKAFEGIPYHKSLLSNGVLPFYSRNHLFYKLLKKAVKKQGIDGIFDTFEYYLSILDLKKLEIIREGLTELNHDITDCFTWEEYLGFVKTHSNLFISALKRSVT